MNKVKKYKKKKPFAILLIKRKNKIIVFFPINNIAKSKMKNIKKK